MKQIKNDSSNEWRDTFKFVLYTYSKGPVFLLYLSLMLFYLLRTRKTYIELRKLSDHPVSIWKNFELIGKLREETGQKWEIPCVDDFEIYAGEGLQRPNCFMWALTSYRSVGSFCPSSGEGDAYHFEMLSKNKSTKKYLAFAILPERIPRK